MADLSLSQNKLTTRTHTLSQGRLTRLLEAVRDAFILMARLERLVEQCYTISLCMCVCLYCTS